MKLQPCSPSQLDWVENQPYSSEFRDVYFSKVSGLEESRYVFLDQNSLEIRWEKIEKHKPFLIVETGFGTGLNFLATWQRWHNFLAIKTEDHSSTLNFFSVEKYPLSKADLIKSLAAWTELNEFSQRLIDAYPPTCTKGLHKLSWKNINLFLYFGDALEGLKQLVPDYETGPILSRKNPSLGFRKPRIDAIYLDGFAPAKNPGMWQADIFKVLAKACDKHSTFSTFTAAGEVRRNLQGAGFICKKIKGFGHKREMLCGIFSKVTNNSVTEKLSNIEQKATWKFVESTTPNIQPHTALVIGAGLAGCHIAYALAKKGIKVSVLETQEKIAQGASGNRRGIVYTRFSPHTEALSRFNLAAHIFACAFYEREGLFKEAGSQCGVLHLARDKREEIQFQQIANLFSSDSANAEYAQWLVPDKASDLAGLQLEQSGLYIRNSGWLDPVKLCQKLLEHPLIEVFCQTPADKIYRDQSSWIVESTVSGTTFSTDLLFIANAYEAKNFLAPVHLPLKQIRGQTTFLEDVSKLGIPKIAICGDGYVAPYGNKGIYLGASFTLNSESINLSLQDHQHNLDNLAKIVPAYQALSQNQGEPSLGGKVGFRTTTSDYFPIAGPVPDFDEMAKRFAPLSKSARRYIDICGAYQENLYCLLGLGSKGLAYAPLLADALTSTIVGEPLSLETALWQHIHPSRFLIRQLIRNESHLLNSKIST